jgi:Zn-dependent protease
MGMGRVIPLGRLFGVKVGMDATVLLIAALYTTTLATNRFPIQAPGHGDRAYWIAGAIGALLFFVSLLVHEVGHALVAKDEGIGVKGISLWLLGGVAHLETSPDNARSELRIAVVGPLASAACGAAFLTGAYLLPDTGVAGLAGYVAEWLGVLNLLLAAFNILPAAPLDGGTVLSALVWKRTGRHTTGLRVSAYSGLATAAALVGFGIMRLRGNDRGGIGLMVILVGGFIGMSAWRSLRSVEVHQLLEGLVAADAMTPAPTAAHAATSVAAFLRTIPTGSTQQTFPVIGDDGAVDGLLTAAALRAVPPPHWEGLRVIDLAYPLDRVAVVRADESLLAALQKVDGADVGEGLVVGADGAVVGAIDQHALQRTAERAQAQAAAFASAR